MKSLYFTIIFILLVLNSCVHNSTYIRHSDLHQIQSVNLEVVNLQKQHLEIQVCYIEQDTCYNLSVQKEYSDFKYLENRRVIKIDSSYYIRSRVKSKRILSKYYNRDIKF